MRSQQAIRVATRSVRAGLLAAVLAAASGLAPADGVAAGDTTKAFPVQVTADARNDVAATTRAIQSAVDDCAKAGGGRVVLPEGEYTLVPLQLRSNVELHLDRGATLKFSRKFEEYALTWIDIGSGQEPGVLSPIHGTGLENVAITGEGTIDGQGDAWRMVKKAKLTEDAWKTLVAGGGVTDKAAKTWYPNEIVRDHPGELEELIATKPASLEGFAKYRPLLRPRLVRLVDCKNVRLEGVTFRDGANWNVSLALCEEIQIRGMTVHTVPWAQNGDGIDLDSCRNATIADCTVHAGDDGICLKSGKDEAGRRRGRPTENVTITGCTVTTGHGGVVIGSEMSGDVRNIDVSNCTFNGTDNGLRFKSTRGRGGVVENINVRDIKMTNILGVAVLFDFYYAANGKPGEAKPVADETTPQFRNFKISNVTCDGAKTALLVRGLPEMPVHNMVMENVHIKATGPGQVTDVRDVIFNNVHVEAAKPVSVQDGARIALNDCTGFGK